MAPIATLAFHGPCFTYRQRSKIESRYNTKDKFALIGLFKGAMVNDNKNSYVKHKCEHKGMF